MEKGKNCTKGYRFGFNGMEKENDINNIDGGNLIFKYRIHDPRLGRFLSVDPLCKEYPWNSTFAFAENSPIFAIDLEGAELNPAIFAKNAAKTMVKKVSASLISPFVTVGTTVGIPVINKFNIIRKVVYKSNAVYPIDTPTHNGFVDLFNIRIPSKVVLPAFKTISPYHLCVQLNGQNHIFKMVR